MYNFAAKALKTISPIYQRSNFIKHFYKAVGVPFELMRPYFEGLTNQSFIDLVDFGIDWQEDKYSLPHRYDLTLEERRALLGLKARKHRPLNPGVLEKYLLENFGLESYLSEKTPGYIDMRFNQLTQESWLAATEFLLREKPAHLALQATHNWNFYIGKGSSPEGFNPFEPTVPKTFDDRKNFPRLFFGQAQVFEGNVDINLSKPKHSLMRLYTGNTLFETGEVTLNLSKPKHSLMRLYAGAGIFIGGEITIGEIFPLEPLEPPEPPKIKETPVADVLIAGVGIAR